MPSFRYGIDIRTQSGHAVTTLDMHSKAGDAMTDLEIVEQITEHILNDAHQAIQERMGLWYIGPAYTNHSGAMAQAMTAVNLQHVEVVSVWVEIDRTARHAAAPAKPAGADESSFLTSEGSAQKAA